MNRQRKAGWHTFASGLPPAEKLRVLLDAFRIDRLHSHVIVVEGKSDCELLEAAARCCEQALGVDVLELPAGVADEDERIAIVSPSTDSRGSRGGASAVTSFGTEIAPFQRVLEQPRAVAFVLDNDAAGRSSRDELQRLGYLEGRDIHVLSQPANGITIASGRQGPVIEDLVGAEFQRAHFESSPRSVRVDYLDGVPTRFEWIGAASKASLREAVRSSAGLADVLSCVALLAQVREGWGLPNRRELTEVLGRSGTAAR